MKNKQIEKGLRKTKEIWDIERKDLVDNLGELGELILEVAFGNVYQDTLLITRERELITIFMLICKGNADL